MIEFTKMHAAGNDFIVVGETQRIIVPEEEKPVFVEKACRRHFGVGADGAIFIQKSSKADLKFHFFNPDGSQAEMCGNGIRCMAKYAYEKGLVEEKEITAETLAGILKLHLKVVDAKVREVKVDMGAPRINVEDIPAAGNPGDHIINEEIMSGGFEHKVTAVGMGNPHAVIQLNNIIEIDVKTIGSRIRNHTALFPNGANVNFIQQKNQNEYNIRTYERGVEAETLACGTGICASAVATVLTGKSSPGDEIIFHARGGDLKVKVDVEDDMPTRVWLTGSAQKVFEGILSD